MSHRGSERFCSSMVLSYGERREGIGVCSSESPFRAFFCPLAYLWCKFVHFQRPLAAMQLSHAALSLSLYFRRNCSSSGPLHLVRFRDRIFKLKCVVLVSKLPIRHLTRSLRSSGNICYCCWHITDDCPLWFLFPFLSFCHPPVSLVFTPARAFLSLSRSLPVLFTPRWKCNYPGAKIATQHPRMHSQ